ncbi:two pore calcium channel protein 1-like isoform X2 [Prunus avium]|uniref:Two pore calcium channel protein 1-like isoform X2 n=1 Tax=Prunus avium TaxID=42229 RepID=A0A6P5TIE2_PRUAV|nr:two pore calcium channel protein 1-like isoform X2 [Prunus avium]
MENKRLLGGEASGVRSYDRSAGFRRRSDAITFGSRYQKAAALVDLAEDGAGLPEQILDQESFQSAAKYYFLYVRFSFLWAFLYFALIILNFLEKPLWCARYTEYTCSDRDYYYLGELPYLNTVESLIYEGITLIVLMVHTFFPISYEGFDLYWKNHLNRFKIMCLLLLVADLVVYVLYLSPTAFDSLPLRIAPYIRVIFFILNFRELRSCMLILAGMLGTYFNILALGLLFLLFASWLAYVMFEDTQQGKTVFTSYGTTLYQMFVLFTTSNNPDVWIPAYKASRWYSLFFVLYVLLGVYFVTNLILAVVYDSFKSQLAKQVSEMDQSRISILKKAFNLLDKDNVGSLNKDQCIQLFEELNKYRTLPKISREEFELIFAELDDSGDFRINLEEFTDLCNAIGLRFPKEDTPSLFEKFPSFYHSVLSEKLKAFVRSPKFGYIISFILIVNLVAVIVETTNYWRDGQNRFDFLVTWIIVIGETITFVTPDGLIFFSNGEWIRYLLIARMLRLIRILMHVQRYRAFVATFLALIPSLMPYLGTIFCVMCIYCTLGVQVFGGIVNAGNASLEGTDLYEDDYLLFNFNDFPNGMVTLFNLLVMGNWQIWMEGYKELTGTWWSLAYFVSFYLITVLLLLNLVVAFVLEAFFAEMDLETSEKCEGDEKEVEGAKDRRRSLGSKTQSQRIDVLLHHMLSAELTETQPSNA